MCAEKMGGGPIDWTTYRSKMRDELRGLSKEELQSRLDARRSELEQYTGHYGEGNSFSNQAEVDVGVLVEMLRKAGS
jgi:hypothetical protein